MAGEVSTTLRLYDYPGTHKYDLFNVIRDLLQQYDSEPTIRDITDMTLHHLIKLHSMSSPAMAGADYPRKLTL